MRLINPDQLLDVRRGAKYLLGCIIKRQLPDGTTLEGRIVETESYHQEDPASHTFNGESVRNTAMFGPPGFAYIYFTYGVHWCFNVTAGEKGYGAGILIRGVEPLNGLHTMETLRKTTATTQLTNGPAKFAQAFAIDKSLYGHNLTQPPLQIFEASSRNFNTVETTRIGISKAVDEIARFYIADNNFVSKLRV